MNRKHCIFHVPNYLAEDAASGSQIRPRKMLHAFEECGYEVDYVMGYGKERKRQIKSIKEKIKQGRKYDFLYSESSTMPTLLTEKNHFPLYPNLDFGFIRFCKANKIKIGLFYRDIYWKFPIYKKDVSFIKRLITIPMYKYDLYKYKKLLNKLYLPSEKMKSYADIQVDTKELPPGCEKNEQIFLEKKKCQEKEKGNISLFYVGGVGELYDLTKLLKVVSKLEYVNLTICCRKQEWEKREEYYKPYLNKRVQIIHKSGKELEKFYLESDICMLFFESEGYRSFAMPIKLFEYLGSMTPIIATTNTSAGEFVQKNGIGWSIPHEEHTLKKLLEEVYNDRKILQEKNANMVRAFENNTWKARARTVINDLTIDN